MITSLLQRFYVRRLLLFFVTLSAPFADAVVLKVAPDKAFKEGEGVHTLRQALEKVEAGDTVKLAPGVYQLNVGMQLAGAAHKDYGQWRSNQDRIDFCWWQVLSWLSEVALY